MAKKMKLREQMCFPVYTASRLITQLYAPFLKELNLTYPQFLVMMVLWENGSLTVGELGDFLVLDSGTLSPLLKKLEALGFIVRKKNLHDQREVLISVTPKGQRLERRTAEVPQKFVTYLNMKNEQKIEYREKTQNFVNVLLKAASDFRKAVNEPKYKRK
jgi:DNA-binding MarR family transcriptional regulator